MFDIIRNNPGKIFIVMLAPAIIAVMFLALVLDYSLEQNDGYMGALLDDTWIHIRSGEAEFVLIPLASERKPN